MGREKPPKRKGWRKLRREKKKIREKQRGS